MLYHGQLCRSMQEKGGERHRLHTRGGRGKERRARSSGCTVDLLVSIPGWNSELRSKSSLRKSNKGSVAALVKLLCPAPQPPPALLLVPRSACRKLNKGFMPVDASSFSISPQTKPYPKETKTDNKILKILKLSKRGRNKRARTRRNAKSILLYWTFNQDLAQANKATIEHNNKQQLSLPFTLSRRR